MRETPRPLTPTSLALALVGAVTLLWALPKLLGVVFTAGLAVVFGLILDAPVAAAERRGVPRAAAAFTVAGLGLGAVVAFAVLVVPQVSSQMTDLLARHGDLSETVAVRVNDLAARLPVDVPEVEGAALVDAVDRYTDHGAGLARGAGMGAMYVIVAAFMALWAVAYPQPLATRLVKFVPARHRHHTSAVARAVERTLRRWVVGQLTVMAAVSVGTYAVLKVLGVPFAELFAVAAGLFEAIPTIGVLLSSAGPVLLVLVDDPATLPPLLIGILLVQQLEDRFLVPAVMGRAVQLPPSLVLILLMTAGALFGIGGMILAAPTAAALIVWHDYRTGQLDVGADGELQPVSGAHLPAPAAADA